MGCVFADTVVRNQCRLSEAAVETLRAFCCLRKSRKFDDASEDFCAMVLVPLLQKKRADLCSNTKPALGPSTFY